ncbi:MAG: 3-isopropylmalate dehydrogenase [Anaerolineae bacterium]|nr:3-isopropylmalate dehydrogenase [Anaerolineae bacterium]
MKIGILEGDYIGPEIMAEAIKVLNAVSQKRKLDVELVDLEVSGKAFDKYGKHLPEHTLEAAAKCDALLKGPFGGPTEEINHPKWSGLERGAILPLRKNFNLYANLRESKVFKPLIHLSPLKQEVIDGVNILIVRELTGGMYFGEQREEIVNGERRWSDSEAYSESEIRRISITAFKCAMQRRKKLTLVAKSNILKNSILWREVFNEVAKEFPDVTTDYMHVDNASMQLVLNPRQFDVIVTSNMFGDILSDEAAVLPGSIGLLPSASLGESSFGLYEPIHGSAPTIAGKNMANPLSMILCIPLMLYYTFNMKDAAALVDNAVEQVLNAGFRTKDLFSANDDPSKVLGTVEFGNAVVEAVLKS